MSKRGLPDLHSDEEAERFVDEADLSSYDLSKAQPARFNFTAESYRFDVIALSATSFVLRLSRGSEIVFDTRPYASRLDALNAARSMKAHIGSAILAEDTPRSKAS